MTDEPRYRYEFYRDPQGEQGTWRNRAQWLIFDRNGVGCMCSVGTEAEAKLIVDALNAYKEVAV